jgi:hypothetical protein
MIAGINSSTSTTNPIYTFTLMDLFLDVRLKKGSKLFANAETLYLSQTKTTSVSLKEMFLDFNLKNKVYFRTGKQVLQWGRNYFWNPTDLINIEKNTFIRRIGYREGAYGTKLHIPFGTKQNIYAFFDTGNSQEAQDTATALKYEFLIGNTENAFSCWSKNNYNTVFGYDFSTRLFKIDTTGEVSVSNGDNFARLNDNCGVLTAEKRKGELIPQAAAGFTKYFPLGNFKDRVSLTTEFFYNGTGYNQDLFGNLNTRTFLLDNNLYQQNYYGRFYYAVFSGISRFILTDMTFTINAITNASDSTGIISTGVTYTDINDFSFGILFIGYAGKPDGEYTYSGDKFNTQLTFTLSF